MEDAMTYHWIGKEDGRSGLEWKIATDGIHTRVYIPGTDHADDVRHHARIRLRRVAPGVWVTAADMELAAEVYLTVRETGCTTATIAGHSWGAAVAALVVWLLLRAGVEAHGFLYAPKRAGNKRFVLEVRDYVVAYRHRGDLMTLLPPWLAAFECRPIGRVTWPWDAHQPYQYYKQMVDDGVRDAD
jgi:pimeloyl-ACP methyl ester carboxylesterase